MKLLYKSLLIMSLGLFFSACEEGIDELGVDPDTFPTASEPQILSGALGHIGYMVDVNLNYTSQLWAQYYTWGIGVSIGNQERFVADPSDYNGYWQRAYASALIDLKFLTASESPAYSGVGKVLQAYVYQGLVDHFGDIPFTEALRGEPSGGHILAPRYDDAAGVYDALIVLLSDGIDDLQEAIADEDAVVVIGDDDLVFAGDLNLWLRFANSLKLRILLRTSEVESNSAAIADLVNTGLFMESLNQMAKIDFSGETGSQNPMWASTQSGVGDFYFASNATVDVLEELGDPRATSFYRLASTGAHAGQVWGIDQGTIDNEPFTAPATNYSRSSAIATAVDASVVLMSPWEVWFLRAEASARYGTLDDETTAFQNAVQANFDYLGVAGGPAYIASINYDAGNPLDQRLDLIGLQKWISMNGTQEDEGWIETRRFDRPASRIFANGIFQNPPLSVLNDGVFPASWLYPATERSLNANARPQRVITDRLFWDN